jgi:hypothetical protein
MALVLGLSTLLAGPATAGPLFPRIVNGSLSFAYPAVGLLLLYDDSRLVDPNGFCSGTLIGCRTFLTAAHCVCSELAEDYDSCLRQGIVDPSELQVMLQHGGYFPVERVAVHPQYRFASGGDVAIIHLAEPVTAIAPARINQIQRLPMGTRGTIVGFGTTGGVRRPDDAGIKRQGGMSVGSCMDDVPEENHICWSFQGADASTCEGDSGGALFADLGDGPLLAGVISGGSAFACTAPDLPFNTDVFVHRDWIMAEAGDDLGSRPCGNQAPIDVPPSQRFERSGSLSPSTPESALTITVPQRIGTLRATLNSQLTAGVGPSSTDNDFDLYVASGNSAGPQHFDCRDIDPSGFGACVIASPVPGPWTVVARRIQGEGTFQMTVTLLAGATVCPGDCNGDGEVTVDEIIEGVGIALGNIFPSICPALDLNGDGSVTVDELVEAVTRALNGCS